MKKKLLYGIFFISIFLLSTASMIQPVYGYEFGVPDEAIGRESEAEITIFDEDEWEAHLGKDADLEDQGYEGDWDAQGAVTKSLWTEIEEKYDDDGIKYLKDHSWKRTIIPGNARVRNIVLSLYNPAYQSDYGPFITIYNGTAWATVQALGAAPAAQGKMYGWASTINLSLVSYATYNGGKGVTPVEEVPGYGKKFDGTYLHREWWYFTDEEYDADPDDDDYKIPFLADPRDFKEAWDYTNNLGILQRAELFDLDQILKAGYTGPNPADPDEWTAYTTFNTTIHNLLTYDPYGQFAGKGPTILASVQTVGAASPLLATPLVNYTDNVFGIWYLSRRIIQGSAASIEFGYPSKAGYLLSVLLANQPMYIPQADFIAKLVEKFYIDDDALVKMPALVSKAYTIGTTTYYYPVYATIDIYTEGVAIIAEIEYKDDTIDPADEVEIGGEGEDELEDFEIVFVYSDTGGLSSLEFKDGDLTFFKQESVSAIPGYEIHILLGASAISIIGLIFVIMKKRKM